MKLQKFFPENQQRTSNSHPSVTLNKTGGIYFNQAASHLLQLQKGNRLAFYSDAENQADWYIQKTNKDADFEIKKYTGQHAFFSMALNRKIKKSNGITDPQTITLKIRKTPYNLKGVTYYLIQPYRTTTPLEQL